MHMLSHLTTDTKSHILVEATHDMSEVIIENGYRPDPDILFNFPGRVRYRRSNVIFLVRDPRDVIVSHFHQVTKRAIDPFIFRSISDFVRDEQLGFKRIIYFYNLWFRYKHIPNNFHLIKYEDLLNNGVFELDRVCKFLGIKCDISMIEDTYNKSSASKMRDKEIKNQLEGFNNFGKNKNQLKVRKAKIGSYLEELNDDDIAYCNIELKHLDKFFNYSE